MFIFCLFHFPPAPAPKLMIINDGSFVFFFLRLLCVRLQSEDIVMSDIWCVCLSVTEPIERVAFFVLATLNVRQVEACNIHPSTQYIQLVLTWGNFHMFFMELCFFISLYLCFSLVGVLLLFLLHTFIFVCMFYWHFSSYCVDNIEMLGFHELGLWKKS